MVSVLLRGRPRRTVRRAALPRRRVAVFALRVAAAAMLVAAPLLASPAHAQMQAHLDFARGHILVKFRDTVITRSPLTAARTLANAHARAWHSIGRVGIQWVDLKGNVDEARTVAMLKANPAVEFAELDKMVRPAMVPNDPSYGSQWHLPAISAPAAWDVTQGSPSVVVAILDTGCDPTHPDLAANYVPGWNFYDGNNNTADVNGHGTAVAGCVGASGNNGIGVASVSWNSKIMPCRVADSTGSAYYSTIASALQWAADHGARIANISFADIPGSSSVLSAAQYMYSKGGITVCAAGNSGANMTYAASPYLVVASATNSSNSTTSWSNYGTCVTVAAPGDNIVTTCNGGGYGGWAGTSFSSPITCGVLALEWAANPNLTPAQAVTALTSSATDLGTGGWDPNYGYGLVNAYGAVRAAQAAGTVTPPTVSITNPTANATVSGTASVGVSANGSAAISKVELYVDNALFGASSTATSAFSWNTAAASNGSHTLMAKAYDTAGNVASTSESVTVSNVDTTAPTVAITQPGNGTHVSGVFKVCAIANDNVGVVKIVCYRDGQPVYTAISSSCSFNLNPKMWYAGAHTLQAFAYDKAGNVGSSAVVTVTK